MLGTPGVRGLRVCFTNPDTKLAGVKPVDVEWKIGKQRFLRVYIDRLPDSVGAARSTESPSGDRNGNETPSPYPKISHADCERVSKQLSVILDVEELIPGPGYVLEVSSPGIDRALKKVADYVRFTGRAAKVWTDQPVDEMKFFEGRLAGVVDDRVQLELNGKTPRTVAVPLTLIRKAHLVVEF